MRVAIIGVVLLTIFSCQRVDQSPDIIFVNGDIWTVDDAHPTAEAFAIKDGRFTAVGTSEDINSLAGPGTEVVDLEGAFIIPGLIEGHGHFSGMGKSLIDLNFLHAESWDEIVSRIKDAVETAEPGEWIEGRGWHQEKWKVRPDETVNGYPLHQSLSAISPDNPVILRHASGHSLMANQKAMNIAGVNAETKDPSGGVVVRDAKGHPIGVFEERAMSIISNAFYEYQDGLNEEDLWNKWYKGIEKAQQVCLEHGITSFQDAGSTFDELDRYKAMAEAGELRIKLWAMARHSSEVLSENLDGYPIINAGNGYFTCRAIKSELDGALGVFGAWKLKPYADKPGYTGQNTTSISELRTIADLAVDYDMQLCVHAIGDKANRLFLDMCDSLWQIYPDGPQWRWRSEHAQHVDTTDIKRFVPLGIIASMQGIHCTSDAPFVVTRLGKERAATGAYAWRSLLDEGVIINNGTDVPVEDINPFECLYASITRKRMDSDEAFFPEQSMTREEAIYSYTMANAIAAFEEDDKGAISQGKAADFVVLSRNLLSCSEKEILETEVLATYIDGKEVYKN